MNLSAQGLVVEDMEPSTARRGLMILNENIQNTFHEVLKKVRFNPN